MARVRLCVCGSWFVWREGQAAHLRAPGQCLHFECRGAPLPVSGCGDARVAPPCPTTLCVCGEIYLALPYPCYQRRATLASPTSDDRSPTAFKVQGLDSFTPLGPENDGM